MAVSIGALMAAQAAGKALGSVATGAGQIAAARQQFTAEDRKRLEELEGIGAERDLAGLPVAKVPPRIRPSRQVGRQWAGVGCDVMKLLRRAAAARSMTDAWTVTTHRKAGKGPRSGRCWREWCE